MKGRHEVYHFMEVFVRKDRKYRGKKSHVKSLTIFLVWKLYCGVALAYGYFEGANLASTIMTI